MAEMDDELSVRISRGFISFPDATGDGTWRYNRGGSLKSIRCSSRYTDTVCHNFQSRFRGIKGRIGEVKCTQITNHVLKIQGVGHKVFFLYQLYHNIRCGQHTAKKEQV